jgi:hypothetical protein
MGAEQGQAMTTDVALAPTEDALIGTLIKSHGSIELAAERLGVQPQVIVDALPDLAYDRLVAGIKAARLLQMFDAFTVMKDVIFQTLEQLTPEGRAKFFIQFMDRLEVALNPPVQGGSGQSPSTTLNQQFNFGSAEAQEDARDQLARRLDAASIEPRSPDDLQEPNSTGADETSEYAAKGDRMAAVVRLGIDRTAEAIRAVNALDDLAPNDGTRIRQDDDGRPNSSEEG